MGVQFHPEYQSSKNRPHPILKEFIEVCKKHGINFIDISKASFDEIEIDEFKFKVFKDALKRKIINDTAQK